MSKLYMDADELLASIKLRGAVPLAQISFQDSDLLNFASEEIDLKIVPSILAVREEFYVTTETIPLVTGQSNYKIPYRAIGGRVRFVYFQGSDGSLQPLAQVAMERLTEYEASNFAQQNSGFFLQNDELIILPPITGTTSGSLVVKYYMKPNKIVETSRGARVTQISGNAITVDSVPTNITPGSEVDFIQSLPNHRTKGYDVLVSTVPNSSTITFASGVPTDLSVGDYICSAGETVIPQVPSELQVMVAQAVICRVLEAIGDTQGLSNATAKLQEMEAKLLTLIDSRVEAPGRKAVNTNTFIHNRRRLRRWKS